MSRLNTLLRGRLRRDARELLRGGPPTAELLRPVGPDVASDDWVYHVLDLCLEVGEVLLSSGESAADTTSTMLRLAGAWGLRAVDIDITFTSITMCSRRGRAAPPVTSLRVVHYRTTDLSRLAAVTDIVDRAVRGELDLDAADAALTRAVRAPHPYPRWVATAGWAGLAAAVALLLGGGPLIWVTAFVVTALVDRVGRLLSRWSAPPFFLQLVGAFVATTATLGLLAVGILPRSTQPSLVIAVSITVLLSGLSVVSAVQDAVTGHPVTSAGRTVEIALLSAGLVGGVVLGLRVGQAFDLTLDPAEVVTGDLVSFWVSAGAAAACAAMYGVASYAPVRSLFAAAVTGGVGWVVFELLTQVHLGVVLATGLAAVVIGVASELFARARGAVARARVDRHVIILSGIIPLLPGLTAYRGLYQLASTVNDVINGLVTVTLALAIALALASGVVMGQLLARRRKGSRA